MTFSQTDLERVRELVRSYHRCQHVDIDPLGNVYAFYQPLYSELIDWYYVGTVNEWLNPPVKQNKGKQGTCSRLVIALLIGLFILPLIIEWVSKP